MRGAQALRLFMTTDAVGGVWTYSLDLAGALAKMGVQTTLAVLGPGPKRDQMEAAGRIPKLQLIQLELPLDWTARNAAELKAAAKAVAKLARASNADFVHLNSPTLAAYADFHAPVVGGCHSCVGTWWQAVKGGRLPKDFSWRVDALGRGYRACDALVAPTNAFAEETAAIHGVAEPMVVHNGRRLVAAPARKGDVIFTAGRLWDAGKNLALIDAAAAQLPVPLYAAGATQSPTGERIELKHVHLLGRLGEREVADWMGRASIFVSTPLYEPFGLSIVEAAQAGCALVLSDIPSLRELWEDAAVFVAGDQPDALRDALQSLLDDPRRTEALGLAARKQARRYTAEAMAEGMASLYRSLVPSRTGALAEAAA